MSDEIAGVVLSVTVRAVGVAVSVKATIVSGRLITAHEGLTETVEVEMEMVTLADNVVVKACTDDEQAADITEHGTLLIA
jgi:hypothetical protein